MGIARKCELAEIIYHPSEKASSKSKLRDKHTATYSFSIYFHIHLIPRSECIMHDMYPSRPRIVSCRFSLMCHAINYPRSRKIRLLIGSPRIINLSIHKLHSSSTLHLPHPQSIHNHEAHISYTCVPYPSRSPPPAASKPVSDSTLRAPC